MVLLLIEMVTSLFILNTDRASIIRVPIMKDGTAGKPDAICKTRL